MNLHQINVGYDAAEDRLLLRISTHDNVEYRFWLTRRLVRALGAPLIERLHQGDALAGQAPAEVQEAMLAFRHESALQQNRFDESYEPGEPASDMEDAPALVWKVQHRRLESGQHQLSLTTRAGATANLQLTESLMHGLIKLIGDAVRVGEWDVVWDIPQGSPGSGHALN